MSFISDIPSELAISAHSGTSHFPEDRGDYERRSYSEQLQSDLDSLYSFARNDEERKIVEEFFPRFREIMRQLTTGYLASKSRCVSWFIAGPSNFPSARMAKRSRWAENKLDHLLAVREKLLKRVRRQMRPDKAPIMSGDADAITRLEAKIKEAETLQERMKAANSAMRKHAKAGPETQIAAIVALGFSEGLARKALEPDFCGRRGFADYQLTNNNANIRRMKARVEEISRAKTEQPTAQALASGSRIEDCPADNRIRLFFPGKPDSTTRDRLKSNGFRWTPSIGCWQAYRNHRAQAVAASFEENQPKEDQE